MNREDKISTLQKIAMGQATPEALKPKDMVFRICRKDGGDQPGLYVNGKLSKDPNDLEEFWKAFAARRVKVVRVYSNRARAAVQ